MKSLKKGNYIVEYKGDAAIISPEKVLPSESIAYLNELEDFTDIAMSCLANENIKILLFKSLFQHKETAYKQMYEMAKEMIKIRGRMKKVLKKLHTIQSHAKPVVAVLDENTASINLSIALWANFRIALGNTSFYFPEAYFGIFPGFGTSYQLLKLIGPERTFELLFDDQRIDLQRATAYGMINATLEDLHNIDTIIWPIMDYAVEIAVSKEEITYLDRDLIDEKIKQILKKTRQLLPGTNACMAIIRQFINAKLIIKNIIRNEEVNEYLSLWSNPTVKNMMRTKYYGIQQAKQQNINSVHKFNLQKVGVLGAGMMGAGIAYELAKAGIEVILKDIDLQQAYAGIDYSKKITDRLVQKEVMKKAEQAALLQRIRASCATEDLKDSDFIIEAIFEDKKLKAQVIKESIPFLKKDGTFASNTTSLPITELANVSSFPQHFIGMHFFSPVDRMPLVEIIRSEETNALTLEKTLYIARTLNKIPIVVNDGPAFFTSRIFFNYLLEAITMLIEGIPAQIIEESANVAGFAVGPLAVLDEISLSLMLHVYDQLPQLHQSQLRAYEYLSKLVREGRNGRKSGQGFYVYDLETGRKKLWGEQDQPIDVGPIRDTSVLQKRLLYVMCLDSYRCLDEGVLINTIDGDIGSLLGVGYPQHTGGVFSFMDMIGLHDFVDTCESFSELGEQWNVPVSLKKLAQSDFSFYTEFQSNWPTLVPSLQK